MFTAIVSRVLATISSSVTGMILLVFLVSVLFTTEPILAADSIQVGQAPSPVESSSLATWWPLPVAALVLYLLLARSMLVLRRLPRFPWTFRPGTGLAFFIFALVAGAVGSSIGLWLSGPFPAEVTSSGTADESLKVTSIVLFTSLLFQGVVLFLMPGWRQGPAPGQSDRRPSTASSIGLGMLAFICVLPIIFTVNLVSSRLVAGVTGEEVMEIGHQTLQMLNLGRDSSWFWPTTLLVVLGVPLVEEMLYRGLLQESLRRHRLLMGGSPWGSITGASSLFTAMHIGSTSPEGLPGLFVLSMGFGWAFARTGRLASAVTMHILFNGLNIILMLQIVES